MSYSYNVNGTSIFINTVLTTPTLSSTPATTNNSTSVASTAFVNNFIAAGPVLGATTTATTQAATDNDTSVATTAFVNNFIAAGLPNGTTATTQATTDNSTKVATTAFVKNYQNIIGFIPPSPYNGEITTNTNFKWANIGQIVIQANQIALFSGSFGVTAAASSMWSYFAISVNKYLSYYEDGNNDYGVNTLQFFQGYYPNSIATDYGLNDIVYVASQQYGSGGAHDAVSVCYVANPPGDTTYYLNGTTSINGSYYNIQVTRLK